MSTVPARPRRGSNDAQLKRIDEYKKDGANMIMLCEPFHLPELHRLVVEEVRIDTTVDNYGNGSDIYKPKGARGFALHLSALERLAVAAAADWVPERTRVLSSDKTYLMCEATAFITREYGRKVAWVGTAEFDLEFLRDDLEDQYKGKENAEYCVNRDYRAKRKQRLKLCMSDAKAVALRKLFGMGGCYPKEVLAKPFIVVRCVVAPDYNDPETQKILRQVSLNAVAGVYGPAPVQPAALPLPGDDATALFDFHEAGEALAPDDSPAPDTETIINGKTGRVVGDGMPAESGTPTHEEAMEADFDLAPRNGRLAMIRQLAARKGFSLEVMPKEQRGPTIGGLGRPIEGLGDDVLAKLFKNLLALADPEPVDDDIPF